MNDILYDRLIYLLEKNEIISLYSNEDSENFCVGYILKTNRDYILMQHISPNGKYDGYIFKKTSDIYRVGYDESYTKKIEKLYDLECCKHEDIVIDSEDILVSFLKIASKKRWIVALELNQSCLYDVQGFVLEVDKKNIVIQEISDDGKYDGITYLDLQCITSGEGDTEEGQSIKLLVEEQAHNTDKR